jgi:hypothetical protein
VSENRCPPIFAHQQLYVGGVTNYLAVVVQQTEPTAPGGSGLIESERRSRTHPVLLQKAHEGVHLRQKQAVAQAKAALLKSLVTLWREEPELRRATMIQGCLFGSFSALWTILALQRNDPNPPSAMGMRYSTTNTKPALCLPPAVPV